MSRAAVFARIVRDAVETLEQLGAFRGAQLGVALDPRALLAHEERDDLELRPIGGAQLVLLGLLLDLAHLAREDRDDGRVVVTRTRALSLPRLGQWSSRFWAASESRPHCLHGGRHRANGSKRMPSVAVRRIRAAGYLQGPSRARERSPAVGPENGFVGRPAILAGSGELVHREAQQEAECGEEARDPALGAEGLGDHACRRSWRGWRPPRAP